MMIFKTSKSLQDKNNIIDLSMIKKFLEILAVLLISFTIIFFTCFGCFVVLNDSTSWGAQTVTLSSEEPANETYTDSMGEYQLAEEYLGADGIVYNYYQHVDREDRFLMYNKLGNMDYYLTTPLTTTLIILTRIIHGKMGKRTLFWKGSTHTHDP